MLSIQLTALRVEMDIEELGAKNLVPMMFVVKQKMSVQSWKLPITFPKRQVYTSLECSMVIYRDTAITALVMIRALDVIHFYFIMVYI